MFHPNQYEKTDHEHIYYNIRIDNPLNSANNEDSESCVYNKQTQNIIDKQSDFELAVESWNVRAKMPVFVCPIVGGTNNNRDLTPFQINYRYEDVATGAQTDYKEDLLWLPDTYVAAGTNLPFPKSPLDNNGIQDFNTNPRYYNCNSLNRMVTMFNNASLRCYNRLNADHPGVFPPFAYLQFDEQTKLFSIIFPYEFLATGTKRCRVSVDALLYKYIDSIPAIFNGYNLNGRDYEIDIVEKTGGHNAWALGNHNAGAVPVPQTNPPAYLIMTQECDSRHLWNNIKQLQITSSSIAVRDEYMPFAVFGEAIEDREQNRFNQAKKSIISYIDLSYGSPNQMPVQTTTNRDLFYRPHIYKWVDLISNGALNNIQIEFSLVMDNGRTIPLQLPNNASASLKIVFRRKNL
tara:strand:- start:461 stop:1675 length:1215 start_codon:yes stop_codon:yes gene_type:complete